MSPSALSAAAAAGASRRVWRIAGPSILANVSVPLLGAVDTAVMGHLPDAAYIGAVAVGATVFSFLYNGVNFLRTGTTGPTAQAAGAGEGGEVRALLARAMLLGLAIALLFLALQGPVAAVAFGLIDASAAVEGHARAYIAIRIWSAPAALMMFAVIGWFFGLQDARVPLVLQVATNGVNIALDLFFVLGLGWGIAGVAAATVIAEYAGLALALVFVARRLRRLPAGGPQARVLDAARIGRMLTVNRDIFLRTMLLVGGFAAFMAQGAGLGDVTLAANQVLLNFVAFASFALDGFAHAAEALVGEAVGRRDRARLGAAVATVLGWSAVFALAFAAAYALGGGALIAVQTTLPAVRAEAAQHLPWVVAAPLAAVWAYAFDGIFLGATRTAAMRNMMALSFAVYIAALWLAVPAWGNHGLWTALMVFFLARGVSLAAAYRGLAASVAPPTR